MDLLIVFGNIECGDYQSLGQRECVLRVVEEWGKLRAHAQQSPQRRVTHYLRKNGTK